MEEGKGEQNSQNILNQEFFDTIKLSKKINTKTKKINEITEFFKKTPNFIDLPEIKNKMKDLYNLLLTNLNENNNNYVLAQMQLIKALGNTINTEENFRNFVKQSLPKLFDKFYLSNQKINEALIEIFNQFISFKILSIKDYYQHIENLPLEEDDNYRINIINFLYENINKDQSILLNNLPKSINELIKKLINDNESDISEVASKVLNVLINRDIESNKKKEQDKVEENKDENKVNNEDKPNINENNKGDENEGTVSATKFVKNIVSAIKKENENEETLEQNKNEEKKENINSKEENKINNDKPIIENEKKEENIIKPEEKKEAENEAEKKLEIKEEKNDELLVGNKEEKKEEKIEDKSEKKSEEKVEEKIKDKKEPSIEEKKEEKIEEVKVEEKKEDKIEEKKEVNKEEKKTEEKVEEKKENENKIPSLNNEEKKPGEKKETKIETEPQKQNLEKTEEKKGNENKPIEETKSVEEKDKKQEENKVAEIKGSSDANKANEKKEEKNNKEEGQKKEEKKENGEVKKEENEKKPKKGGVKRSGIKSQISKFRKNIKNKKKTDGFEFELVEKKKDGNIETNQIIPEEKDKEKETTDNTEIKDKPKEQEIKTESKENIQEKENKIQEQQVKEEKIEEKPKEEKKEEIKIEPKKEEIKEELKEEKKIEEKPKEELKEEKKVEEKPQEEVKEEKKIIPKKKEVKKKVKNEPKKEEKKEEIEKPEIKEEKKEEKKEEISNNIDEIEPNAETHKKSIKIVAANQQSLNEFERKLQLALEQEEKEGLLNKNSNENLTDANPTPVKQKKEDPKFDEIKSVLGKEIIDLLFSPKWEQKKHGFELINEFVNSKPQNSYNLNDLLEYMKLKLKNYKETNFNINREAINIYVNMIKKKIISKDLLTPIILAYHEKLADIKLKENLIELINNSFDIIEPNTILKQILTKISKKNNAKLLIEYSTFLGNVVEEYDVKDLPNKDIIDFCKVMANNSNPQVRTAAISLLCILYKYLGKDVKTLTRDIKESTLKLIDAELDKVTVIDPKESAAKKKKVAGSGGEGKGSSGGGGELIPPQDISKKITAQMIKDLNGKWAEKKEACENMEKVLVSANMRILPNGLNNIMTAFKKKLSDSNKNFVKMIVSLLSKFIEALKQGFKQWTKPIALALIPNLADKNQLMRNECQNCFDKWVEFTGFDSLVVHFPQFLKTDNVEMRIEIMNFFIKYKDKFNKTNGELVYKDMMNPLLICLQDRSSNVRNAAEEIIKSSLNFISINNYYKKSEDFKPAITKTLKQILDKIKRETANSTPQENNNNESESNQQQQTPNLEENNNKNSENTNSFNIKKAKSKSRTNMPKVPSKKNSIQMNEPPITAETSLADSEKNESINDDNSNYNTVANFSKTTKKNENKDSSAKSKKNINVKRAQPKRKLSEDDLVNPLGTAMNKQMPVSSVSHLASNSTILKKNEKKSFQKTTSASIKTTAVFLMNVKVIPSKSKRYEKDKRTKFSLETVSKDYFNKLKDQCKGLFTEDFSKKIFSDDFRKQVEAFKEMKAQIDKKINTPIYFDNLDLILKIIGIKIMNNLNPTLMKNFFEFLDSLFVILSENKYKLNETESSLIINILIDKLSLNNNTLREHLISLLFQYIEYMDTDKTMVIVLNVALNKNSKIKTDILDLTLDLTLNQKLNIANKTYAKILCKFLPSYENAIKTKTLSLFQEIYSKIKDELWNMIEISDKDREFLEENLCIEDDEEEEEEEDEFENGNEENKNIIKKDKHNGNANNNENLEKTNTNNKITPDNNNNNANNALSNQSASLNEEDFLEALENLSSKDPTEKLNTIIVIHEMVCGKFAQNKDILISNVDKIITTFKTVSHELFFVKDLNTIPIKFAKYIAIVLCKLASNKELIQNISYNVLLDLSRELLSYLLITGLDKIGNNQEGNIIFKSINSTMLRVLENCDMTSVICALLELIKEFQEKGDKNLINLSIKCLLKTTHNLSSNIDNIKIDKILLQMHLLLLNLQKKYPDFSKRSQNDNLIFNTVKNIVGDFVKIKKDKILDDYSRSVKNHEINDKFLLQWIKSVLEKL